MGPLLFKVSVAWLCNIPSETDQPRVAVHAGALPAVPVSFCYTSVHQNRPDPETAFAKQNEGLFTGEALLKDDGNPASCTLGVRKEIEIQFTDFSLLSKSFAAILFQLYV